MTRNRLITIKKNNISSSIQLLSTSGFATTHVVVSVRHPITYRVHSLYFVKNPYNPYMISCTDFRKSVHKIRTSVHKIRTSGFKSVHMLFKFYLFFTCHSCIWKVMSLEPYIFSQYIVGWQDIHQKWLKIFFLQARYSKCVSDLHWAC